MRKAGVSPGVFEITDYTNSTEFEEFIYSVEQVIEKWGLSKGGFWNNESLPEFSRTESLTYGRQSFRLTHSTLNVGKDFKSLQQADFPPKTHCLNRWYGLSEFIILSPETADDAIYFLDSSKLLMSSLASALTRTQCNLPMFIQLGSLSKRFYSGIWLSNSLQTTLDMVLLKSPPPQCSSLKEILCFYKRSIPCSISPFPQTFISVRYTFCLHNFIGCLSDDHVYSQNKANSKSKLPFGSVRDPVQDFLLATSWMGLSEHLISDSESGELDPLRATQWSIRYTNTSNSFCILYNFVDYVASLLTNDATIISLLGTSVDDNIEVDVSAAFRTLTAPKPIVQVPSFDITMLPGKLLGTYGAFVDKEILASYMHYIFEEPYDDEVVSETRSSHIKSCPRDSITHRITVSLCLVLCTQGGIKGFAQLWRCIIEQLRFHYEKGKNIPGASTQPDPALSLLHQKIQMLNACIKQKIERGSVLYASGEAAHQHESDHETLTLLLTGEQLRIPLTQRHSPMTEDMQEEHMEALAKLGSSAEGSRLRTELHSLSLLSDMQAFKAANPNCRLEDFIRWYSPRDWITVPITRPLIPEDTVPDLAEAADKSGDEELQQEDELDADEGFANLDAAGNTEQESESVECHSSGSSNEPAEAEDTEKEEIVRDESSDELAEVNLDAAENAEQDKSVKDKSSEKADEPMDADDFSEQIGEFAKPTEDMESCDKASDEMVSPTDVDVDVPSDKIDEKMDDQEIPKPTESFLDGDEYMASDEEGKEEEEGGVVNQVRSSVGDDSDDEFVDAEEHTFQSVSEASDRMMSPDNAENLEKDAPINPSEVSEKNKEINSHLETKDDETLETKDDETLETENPPEPPPSAIKHEEPLDPDVYGGHLSARMSKESVWKEVWYVAKPIPIWQQKRLFDDTKEAERILHYFIQSEMRTLATLLMPSLLHAAYDRIVECPDSNVYFIKEGTDKLLQKLKDLRRYTSGDTDIYQEMVSDIYDCELLASKYHSIKNKLSYQSQANQSEEPPRKMTELERRTRRNIKGSKLSSHQVAPAPEPIINEAALFEQLISSEAEVVGAARSAWGSVLQRLFHAQQAAASRTSPTPAHPRQIPIFPLPIGREYILQTVTKHPSPASRDCLQRMFVTVSGSEFRMAYANSSDKTFL